MCSLVNDASVVDVVQRGASKVVYIGRGLKRCLTIAWQETPLVSNECVSCGGRGPKRCLLGRVGRA